MMHADDRAAYRPEASYARREGPQPDDRSLGDLFSELSRESSTLIRQEIALARAEMTEKATRFGRNAAYVAIGGAVAYVGAIVLAFAVVYLLGTLMPDWVAALLVGAVIAGVGYVLIQKGLTTLRETRLTPDRTVQSLKEDKQWLTEQVK